MSLIRRYEQWGTFARIWHLFDATWQDPYKSANRIKQYLMGSYKPIYHPLSDCGDHVVIINSKEIALRGEEWRKRVYYHFTGYAQGASWTLAWELHNKDPTLILQKAIYKSMRGNLQRRYTMQRLHIYPDDNVPEEIMQNVSSQIKQLRLTPTRLDHIPPEDIEKYPRMIEYPEDYKLR